MSEKIVKDNCAKCKRENNHELLFSKTRSDWEDDYSYNFVYAIIQCLGCENIQFKYTEESFCTWIEEEVRMEDIIQYYPQRKYNSDNQLRVKIYNLPKKIRITYEETLSALNNDLCLLAGIALRAIIEALCIENNIDGKNLDEKINNLESEKLITKTDKDILHGIRFIGNDAVHDIMEYPKDTLMLAFHIVERLLENIYTLTPKAQELLDVPINEYKKFERLVLNKFEKIGINNEKTIQEILGKNIRRIKQPLLDGFINDFINEIKSGAIPKVSLGKLDNNQQYFKLNYIEMKFEVA